MGSRDFGFLSLRPPLVAYQANGLPVPANNVLITSNTGAASFASTITISTINVNTENANSISSNVINANTISATFIDVSILSTTTHYTSSISTTTLDTGYLQAGEALINGPLKVYGNAEFVPTTPSTLLAFKIQLNGTSGTDVASSNLFVYRYPGTNDTYLTNDGGGSLTLGTANPHISTLQINSNGNVNVNGDLTVSDTIYANTITTQYLSTFSTINLMNGNASTLELTWNASTLYVGGHPVATDGTVSTVSTVFWDDLAGNGSIFNKNIGIGTTKYLVGIGTNTNPLNATLDVQYIGSGSGNVLNVSTSNDKRLTYDSNGVLSTNTINMNGSLFINNTLHISTAGGNGALKIQSNSGNTYIESGNNFTAGSANKVYFTSMDAISTAMVIDTNNRFVGINTATPLKTLDVNGSIILTSSNVGLLQFTTQNGDSFIESDNILRFTNIGASSSTMVLLSNPNPHVGINTQSPTETLTVNSTILVTAPTNGTARLIMGPSPGTTNYDYCSAIEASNTQASNYGSDLRFFTHKLATTGGVTQERMIIDNAGNVGINTSNPQTTLDINGNTTIHSTLSTNYGIINQNNGIRLIDGFGNNSARPTLTPTNTLSSFVIHGGSGSLNTNDDGFLQLSAGGGTGVGTISYIQLSGFSGNDDMNRNIVFGTAGAEQMRITSTGNVGIGTYNPQAKLAINGNIILSDSLIISSSTGNKTGSITQNATTMLIESEVPLQLYPSGSGQIQFLSSDSATSGTITVNNGGPLELSNSAGDIVIHSQTGVTQFTSASNDNVGQITINDTNGVVTLYGAANTSGDIVTLAVNNIYIEPGATIDNISSVGSKSVYMGMTQGDATVYIQNSNTSGTSGTCQLFLNDTYPNGKKYQLANTSGTFYLTDTTNNITILDATVSAININTNLNVTGTAISRVATVAITSDPGISGWANFLGKYCFVNGNTVGTLTLPTNVTLDGTILVIRNIGSSNLITIVNSIGGTSILPGKTTSYIYTATVTPSGWYAL